MIWIIMFIASLVLLLPVLAAGAKDTKKCPHCGSFVLPKATVCKHCSRDLAEAPDADRSSSQV